MSYTMELIEKYKTKLGFESDYAAAKALGLNPNRLSNYRCGVSHADDKMAVVLADHLGLDRFATIARINADRAKDAKTRAFWKRLSTAAALMIGLALHPAPAAAAGLNGAAHSPMYIMSNIGRWLR